MSVKCIESFFLFFAKTVLKEVLQSKSMESVASGSSAESLAALIDRTGMVDGERKQGLPAGGLQLQVLDIGE